jgi:hypothetical protein
MSITLPTYANGDTDYVAKMNQTNSTVQSQLNSLQDQLTGSLGASVSVGSMIASILGTATACVGTASYVPTGSGTNLTVATGYAWIPSSGLVVQRTTTTTIAFSGASAATYYLDVDTSGNVSRVTTSGANTLWSIVWTGSAFGAITRVAPVLWGSADIIAAQSSAAYSATYYAPDARFEASESRIVAIEAHTTSLPYDSTIWQAGLPGASQVLLNTKMARAVAYAANFAGSTCAPSDVAATASAVFSIKKNGTTVGSATYAASGTVATFTSVGGAAVSFAVGDVLTVVAPASQDATLSGIALVLAGSR